MLSFINNGIHNFWRLPRFARNDKKSGDFHLNFKLILLPSLPPLPSAGKLVDPSTLVGMTIFLSSAACLLFPLASFAHPLDISANYFSLQGKEISATTYFHTYEIDYLLQKTGKKNLSIEDYYDNQQYISQYLKDSLLVKQGDQFCEVNNFTMPKKLAYELLTNGVEVNYIISCPKEIDTLNLEVNFFIEFPLQTNRMSIYKYQEASGDFALYDYKVLTAKIPGYKLVSQMQEAGVDTDGDGLSDEEEKVYKTDISNPDTDSDFYSDYEEVVGGWYPLDKALSPGQTLRYAPLAEIKTAQPASPNSVGSSNSLQLAPINSVERGLGQDQGFITSYLKNTLKSISQYVELGQGSFFMIFCFVVVLGFLHALGPGHAKSLLVGYVTDQKKSYWQGLLFCLIFSVTHLLDVVALFVLTKFFFTFIDMSQFSYYLQLGSLLVLFFLSAYLIGKNLIGIIKSTDNHQEKHTHTHNPVTSNISEGKSQLLIGFLAGLAPCSFGWSLFLLLFSLQKISLVLPLLLALGLGIFLCLVIIMSVSIYLRDRVYGNIGGLARYSGVLSSTLLLCISLYLGFILLQA